MSPTYKEKQKLLTTRYYHLFLTPKIDDIIVLSHPTTGEKILKRITGINQKEVFVTGDNKKKSTDSRSFGWIDKKNIIGKVIYPV